MWQASTRRRTGSGPGSPGADQEVGQVRVWRSLDAVPADLGRSVVTIGNFDGVHRGHQHVVTRAHQVAGRLRLGHVVAVTFDPHPMAVLRPEHAPPTLTGIDERVALLAAAGVDDVLVLPFTREIAEWPPERFVEEVLVSTLHAAAVVVGANFRFGRRAAGDVALLHQLGEDNDFLVEGVPLDGGPQVWSSTYVRTCLAAGDVEGAAEALGRPVSVHGVVQRGDQRGRELGYPTANVPATTGVPADGVYAGWLEPVGAADRLPAAISVGTNPTFAGERSRRVEAYVLDRTDLELYDREVEVTFVKRLRGMLAFDSVDDLLSAMRDDVDRAREVLGG
jgi:riboflavin kinase/FMN adenylyltransferase